MLEKLKQQLRRALLSADDWTAYPVNESLWGIINSRRRINNKISFYFVQNEDYVNNMTNWLFALTQCYAKHLNNYYLNVHSAHNSPRFDYLSLIWFQGIQKAGKNKYRI